MNAKVSYGSLPPALIGGLGVVVMKLFEKSTGGESPVIVKEVSDVIEFSDSGIWGDESLDPDEDPRVFRVSDFAGDFRLDYESAPARSIPDDKLKKYQLHKGDILVVKASGSASQVVSGRVAVFEGHRKCRYVGSNFVLRFRPKKEVDSHYLAFVLGSPPVREAVANSVKTMTYPNLSFRTYSAMEVPLIPLQDQRVFASFFNALLNELPLPELPTYLAEQREVVARIQTLAVQIHAACQLRQKAVAEAQMLVSSASEDLFRLRPGWIVAAIEDFCEPPQYGYTASAVEEPIGPRFLRITDIQDGRVGWNQVPFCHCPQPSKYLLKPGDLVFTRTGATTGKSYVIRECPDAVFASYLIRLRVRDMVSVDYLHRYFQSPGYWEQIADKKKGTGQPNLSGSKLKHLKVPIPPPDEQRRIVAELGRLQVGVDALKCLQADTAAELDALLASILDHAFKGEL